LEAALTANHLTDTDKQHRQENTQTKYNQNKAAKQNYDGPINSYNSARNEMGLLYNTPELTWGKTKYKN